MATKQNLTELIDYQRDIAPYKTILIKAPVGSGKNYFMGQLALGNIESGNPCVCMVTSRLGVVNQTINDGALLSVFARSKGLRFDQGRLWQAYQLATIADGEERFQRVDNRHSAVMTMAQMFTIYDGLYRQGPEVFEEFMLWPWTFWDVLVFDEIHALLMDSTFTLGPPHILDLIEVFSKSQLPLEKKMILTSGTADCIQPLLQKKLGKIHVVSKTTQAKGVLPSSITWTNQATIKQDIFDRVRKGEKVIYFYVGKLIQIDEFLGPDNMDLLDVSVSIFSNVEEMEVLKKHNLRAYDLTMKTLESVSTSGLLPDEVKLVISSPRWKEGVNLENLDIKWLFLDTHITADIIQFSGRIRKSDFTLVINHDADQKGYITSRLLEEIQENKAIIADENEIISCESGPELYKHIDSLEKPEFWINGENIPNDDYRGFEGIYFDWFSGQFRFNELMKESLKYRLRCINEWNKLDKASNVSYSNYIRAIFNNRVTNVEKLLLPEYQAKKIYKTFKFEEGGIYSPEKVSNFLSSIKEEVWPNVKRVNEVLKRIQYLRHYTGKPILQFQIIKNAKKNGYYKLVRRTVKKPKDKL